MGTIEVTVGRLLCYEQQVNKSLPFYFFPLVSVVFCPFQEEWPTSSLTSSLLPFGPLCELSWTVNIKANLKQLIKSQVFQN